MKMVRLISFIMDEGRFVNKTKTGRGKMSYFAAIPLISDHFRQFRTIDDLIRITPDQLTELTYRVYKGKFSNDAMSGFGKMIYANGDVYVGHWQNNMKSGRGQMRYNNGYVFFGTWHNDHPAPTVFGRVVNEAEPTPAIFTAVDPNALPGFQNSANMFERQ